MRIYHSKNKTSDIGGSTRTSQTMVAIDRIHPLARIVEISSNGAGPITLSSNPQIDAGNDGQRITLIGVDDANPVTISHGNGLILNSGVGFQFGKNRAMDLTYDSADAVWKEDSRSDNPSS